MSAARIRQLGCLAVVAGLTLLAGRAPAQYTWIATTSGNWSNSANWTGGVPVSGTTTSLTFGDGTYTATDDLAATPFMLTSMTFNNSSTNTVTISDNGQGLDFVGTSPTITRGAGNVIINPNITLGANLTTAGAAGTLTLNGTVNDNGGGFNITKTGAGTLVFANAGTSSYNALSVVNGSANITAGTVNLNQPDPGTRLPGLQIGNGTGSTGTVTISGGSQVTVAENTFIGDGTSATNQGTGTLNVTGAGTVFTDTGSLSGRFAVGNWGNGTLNITAGAVVNARFLLTNRESGSSATILVDGPGTILSVATAASGTGDLQVASNNSGTNGGTSTATMTVSNGGTVSVVGTFFLGASPGNTGTLNVTGAGSNMSVSGVSQIGSGSGTTAGTGIMNVSNGGSVAFPGGLALGNDVSGGTFGTGTVNVSGVGSTLTVATQTVIGANGGSTGNLNILNGATSTIAGNVFLGATGVSGSIPAAVGTITVSGAGSTLNLSGTLIDGGGATPGGTGTINVSSGGVINAAGQSEFGQNTGSIGNLNVTAGGTYNATGSVFLGIDGSATPPPASAVGNVVVDGLGSNFNVATGAALVVGGGTTPGGVGNLTVSNGGTVTTPFLTVGNNTGSTGNVLVTGGNLVVTGEMDLGDGGPGTLTITNGGTALIGGTTFAGPTASITGTITVSGFKSTLNIPGTTIVAGNAGAAAGIGTITGNALATVNLGSVFVFAGGTLNVNTGPLGSFTLGTLGDGISGATPSVGTIAIGSGSTLTINNSTTNVFDGVISGAGAVTKSASGTLVLTAANTYSGGTNINGGILNFASLGNLGTGPISFNGGTLQYASGNTADISTVAVTINNGGATIDTGSNNVTYANAIGNNLSGTGLVGGLTKQGTGTLTLNPAPPAGGTVGYNTYFGVTNVQNGTLSVPSDLALGVLNTGTAASPVFIEGGDVTGAAAGTLAFTGTTTTLRNYAMNGGTISVTAGNTVTFSGGQVSGAVLDGVPVTSVTAAAAFATGTGGTTMIGVSTTSSVTLTSNSGSDLFKNFTNGGNFNLAAGINTAGNLTPTNLSGFNNKGSGFVNPSGVPVGGLNVGAGSQLNVANFQSSGMVSLTTATTSGQFTELANTGASALNFNAGSQTFVGLATAPNPNAVGVDLHGQNMFITGGLFVNNGLVFSSSGTSTIYVEYGATYKGAGTTNVPIVTQNGGKVLFGNSPGLATYGSQTIGPGALDSLQWQINDAGPSATFPSAPGVSGPSANGSNQVSGWAAAAVTIQTPPRGSPTTGNLIWAATPSSQFDFTMETLAGPFTTVGGGTDGAMSDFDPTQSYDWKWLSYQGSYTGPTDSATLTADTLFDKSSFANAFPSSATFAIELVQYPTGGGELDLLFTPVPEPGTLALTALAGLGLARTIRRRYAKATVAKA